jgi:3-isopropylmalate/(R)-2-methylmalate dehydratase small subunit
MSTSLTRLRIRRVAGVISTDDIIPGRYKHMYTDAKELAKHVFENLLPGFAATLKDGDALYCNDTFGIGSSREQAVSSLMAAGVKAVLAPRFGRIFFRNAWNLGLISVEIAELPVEECQLINLDAANGKLTGPFGAVSFVPPPPAMLQMIAAGGLLALVRERLRAEAGGSLNVSPGTETAR